MDGICHFWFGVSCGSMIALNLSRISELFPNIAPSAESATIFVLGGILGSLLPDIDNVGGGSYIDKNGKKRENYPSYIARLVLPEKIIKRIQKNYQKAKKKAYQHRGFLHNPAIYIACLLISYFFLPCLVGLFVGCLSHIFLDMLNPSGVPFLGTKRLHLARINSGSKESIICTQICSAFAVIIGTLAKLIELFPSIASHS